jgi:hypothetical protein
MAENNQSEKLDDATEAFAEAAKNQKENNIQNEEKNMENEIKNEVTEEVKEEAVKKEDCAKKKLPVNPINLSIFIASAILFCFSFLLFIL